MRSSIFHCEITYLHLINYSDEEGFHSTYILLFIGRRTVSINGTDGYSNLLKTVCLHFHASKIIEIIWPNSVECLHSHLNRIKDISFVCKLHPIFCDMLSFWCSHKCTYKSSWKRSKRFNAKIIALIPWAKSFCVRSRQTLLQTNDQMEWIVHRIHRWFHHPNCRRRSPCPLFVHSVIGTLSRRINSIEKFIRILCELHSTKTPDRKTFQHSTEWVCIPRYCLFAVYKTNAFSPK